MPRKLTYEEVKKTFEDNGCQLISTEYLNSKTLMKYICNCGNHSEIRYTDFKRGVRCKKCCQEKINNKLRHDFNDVKDFYKNCGCDLLETKYNTVHQKMKFKCHCGKIEDAFTFKQFKGYKQCRDCCGINYYNLDTIKALFEMNGCVLITKYYINNKQEVEYICSCGKQEKTIIHNYIHSLTKKCKKCAYAIVARKQSLEYDYVKQYFVDNGCVLLSKEYVNNNQLLDYVCDCGNVSKITFNSFQFDHRCSECARKKLSEINRKSLDEVYDIFKNNNCVLLEKYYENSRTQKLKYICSCGREDHKTLSDFMSNPKCPTCKTEYLSFLRKGKEYPERRGENHPQWRFDLTLEEREKGRFFPEYKDWRKAVYERDKYTCQCCGDDKGGNLNAHHLDGYDWNKIDRFNIENGITLCNLCHKDFHALYGYGHNTKEQFEEYMNEILSHNKQSQAN